MSFTQKGVRLYDVVKNGVVAMYNHSAPALDVTCVDPNTLLSGGLDRTLRRSVFFICLLPL